MSWYDYPALVFWGSLTLFIAVGVVLLVYDIIMHTSLKEWLLLLGSLWVVYSVAWALHRFNLLENV